MTHSHFEDPSLREDAQRAIESHGQPEYTLDPASREMRSMEHTGIELTAAELAYLKKITSDRIRALEGRISLLKTSLDEGDAPNTRNTEEELQQEEKELDFLQNNLVEKLFGETGGIDNKTTSH